MFRKQIITLKKQHGFTILELMIATTIFSVVLLVASSGVIAIGRIYSKGIISSKTQEVSRSAMEDLSRSIQFSKGSKMTEIPAAPGGMQSYCFGEDVYSYQINVQVDLDVPGVRALVHSSRTDLSSCIPNFTGEELLADNMRLLDFSIDPAVNSGPNTPGSQATSIKIRVAYGDDDLLSHYDNNGALNGSSISDATCKGGAGGSFCATAELVTSVSKRV